MNYSYAEIKRKQTEMLSASRKMKYRTKKWLMYCGIFFVTATLLMLIFGMAGAVRGIVDSALGMEEIDFREKGYASTIYDSDGNELQSLGYGDTVQEYVDIKVVPECVQHAFVAAEDKRFYEHHGVDMLGLIQAVYSGITGERAGVKEMSTITQQLIQNHLLGDFGDSSLLGELSKAVKEQYLAIELEDNLDKSKILEYYLNTINLGQNMTGVQAASKRYFDKNISDVNASEAAVLAAIASDPTRYNPIYEQENNARRRRSVLKNMLEKEYISEDEYEDALGDDVYLRIQNVNNYKSNGKEKTDSYYGDAVVEQVIADLKTELGYSETEAYNALYRRGLRIYTCQDASMQKICDEVINSDEYYPTTVRSYLSYQLVVEKNGVEQEYSEINIKNHFIDEKGKNISLYFTDSAKAKSYVRRFREDVLKDGGVIVSESIQLVKQPQTSFVLIEQSTGKVKAIVGGRGSKKVNRSVNRATEFKRQPGAVLTILSTYTPALDTAGMTLGSVEDDTLFHNQEFTEQENQKYEGPMTLRTAMLGAKSIPAVKTLQNVSVQTGYEFLKKFCFTTLVKQKGNEDGSLYSDLQEQLALGKLKDGVTNLELTAAYASVAAGGVYRKPRFYTRIVDRDGNVLIENEEQKTRIIKEETAWLLTDVMQENVLKGEASTVQFDEIGAKQAGYVGKLGENADLWFEGYTPYYTAGIWSGTDESVSQKDSAYHMVIWKEIMERVHKEQRKRKGDFKKPSSIISRRICSKCGNLAVEGLCEEAEGGSSVQKEYFVAGTEPVRNCNCHVKYAFCSVGNGLANEDCPKEDIYYRVLLQKKETATTADTPYTVTQNVGKGDVCTVHGKSHQVR